MRLRSFILERKAVISTEKLNIQRVKNTKNKRLTTTKILVYCQFMMCASLLTLFIYAAVVYIGTLRQCDWKSMSSSNPYISAYATLLTQIVVALGTVIAAWAYIIRCYMNKSGLEFIFKSEGFQIEHKLGLQERYRRLDIYPEKDVKTDLDKIDERIDKVKEARIKKVTEEDITQKL